MENQEKETARKRMKDLSEKDFDGHTDFDRMTPEKRLEWLAAAAKFSFEARKTPKR